MPTPARPGWRVLIGAVWLTSAAFGAPNAWAGAGEQCAADYERAQELRRAGSLVVARTKLLGCASAACPTFITTDCRRWLDEVDGALPSVVFAARAAGRDLERVEVKVDGRLVASRLDGRAIALDPGKHRFTFVAPGHGQGRVDAIINEGSKHRLIAVDLAERAGAAPAPPLTLERRSPPASPRPWVRGLFMTGAIGLAGFAGFGLWGLHGERGLRDECAPRCAPARVDGVRRRYLAADLGLAIGAVALGLGAYLDFRPQVDDGLPRLAFDLVAGGATLSFGERF